MRTVAALDAEVTENKYEVPAGRGVVVLTAKLGNE